MQKDNRKFNQAESLAKNKSIGFIQKELIHKIKNRVVDIPKNEKIALIVHQKDITDFVGGTVLLSIIFPLVTIFIALIDPSLSKTLVTILLNLVFNPVIILIARKVFARYLKFQIVIFTDLGIYLLDTYEKYKSQLILRIPYNEINAIFFGKSTKSQDKGFFQFYYGENYKKYEMARFKNFTSIRIAILSLLYNKNDESYQLDNFKRRFPKVPLKENLIYNTSEKGINRIEKKKRLFKRIILIILTVDLVFIILYIIENQNIIIHNLLGDILFTGLMFEFVAIVLIPTYFKDLNKYSNSNRSTIKILKDRIEIEDMDKNPKIKDIIFRKDLVFNLFAGQMTYISDINNINKKAFGISCAYLSEKSKDIYLGKMDNILEFFFNLNSEFVKWLKSQNYFISIDEIQNEYFKGGSFNLELFDLFSRNSEKYQQETDEIIEFNHINQQKQEYQSKIESVNESKTESESEYKWNSQSSLNLRNGENLPELKYSLEDIKMFFEENEKILEVFHPNSAKAAFLKPKQILFGILVILVNTILILGVVGKIPLTDFGFIIFVVVFLILGIIGAALYIIDLSSSIFQYFDLKSSEILFTNKKLIIIWQDNISIILYANITQLSRFSFNKRTNEYARVELWLKKMVKTLPKEFYKHTMNYIPKTSPIFPILVSNGIKIYGDE